DVERLAHEIVERLVGPSQGADKSDPGPPELAQGAPDQPLGQLGPRGAEADTLKPEIGLDPQDPLRDGPALRIVPGIRTDRPRPGGDVREACDPGDRDA